MEKAEYKGWKNNIRLANGDAEVIVTLDVGPRVISYKLSGGENVFKEYPDQLGKSAEPDWQIRGGHRLWIGPEDLTRTYAPTTARSTTRRFHRAGNALPRPRIGPTACSGKWTCRLAPSGSQVTVTHRVTNTGDKPVELAVWALSVMAPADWRSSPCRRRSPTPAAPRTPARPPISHPTSRLPSGPSSTSRTALEPRQQVHHFAAGQDEGADQARPAAPSRLGWLPHGRHAFRQAFRPQGPRDLSRQRRQLRDLHQRGHARDREPRAPGENSSPARASSTSSTGNCTAGSKPSRTKRISIRTCCQRLRRKAAKK